MSLLTEINANTQAVKTSKKNIQKAVENKGGTVFDYSQYSQYYVTGGSISSLGVAACEYDGPWSVTNLKYGYFKVGEKLYCLMADGSSDKLVNFIKYTNMWLEGVLGVSCYIKEYNFSTNTWGAVYSGIGIECKPLPITVYSETEYSLYLANGTLIYDPNALPTFQNLIDGVGSITELKGEEKTVSPTTMTQEITPSANKNGITKVTVKAVTSAIDSNIVAENIKKDVEILGVTGTLSTSDIHGTEVLPLPVTNVKVTQLSTDTLQVSWVNPSDINRKGITVRWKENAIPTIPDTNVNYIDLEANITQTNITIPLSATNIGVWVTPTGDNGSQTLRSSDNSTQISSVGTSGIVECTLPMASDDYCTCRVLPSGNAFYGGYYLGSSAKYKVYYYDKSDNTFTLVSESMTIIKDISDPAYCFYENPVTKDVYTGIIQPSSTSDRGIFKFTYATKTMTKLYANNSVQYYAVFADSLGCVYAVTYASSDTTYEKNTGWFFKIDPATDTVTQLTTFGMYYPPQIFYLNGAYYLFPNYYSAPNKVYKLFNNTYTDLGAVSVSTKGIRIIDDSISGKVIFGTAEYIPRSYYTRLSYRYI